MVKKGVLFALTKTGMDDFRRNDNFMRAINDVSGKMSNDKSREVKHATPELSGIVWTHRAGELRRDGAGIPLD